MKKEYLMFLPVLAIMTAACSSSKSVAPDKLDGTWNIVEIDGRKIVTGDPYIGFDADSGRVYGNSGCNRITGVFDPDGEDGVLSLDKLGSTRMMCADMSTENSILNAFSQVEGFAFKKDAVVLTDSAGNDVAMLKRRCKEIKVERLDGEWSIKSIRGEEVSRDLSKKLFISFDSTKMQFYGNDGCNSFNGEYKVDGTSLSFSSIVSTLMACPDVEIEGQVQDAINNTAKFGQIPDGNVGLFDADDNLLLELVKI